jgi:ubiquinone biosynthesis protein COQ9
MDKDLCEIKDEILLSALEDVAFDGWQWRVIEAAAEKAGHGADMAVAVFPDKLEDVVRHFSDWADREMMQMLQSANPQEMRVRDRVRRGVIVRLHVLEPHKEAVRAASNYWLVPTRQIDAGKVVWQTADKIWQWAGDDSTDYNHYTKRLLLSGVLTSTTLTWLNDTSPTHQNTVDFLDRRIDNVLKFGRVFGNTAGKVLSGLGQFKNKFKAPFCKGKMSG